VNNKTSKQRKNNAYTTMLGSENIWLGTLMSMPYGLKFWLGTSLPCLNGCAAYAFMQRASLFGL
jgi:hypothetical protein